MLVILTQNGGGGPVTRAPPASTVLHIISSSCKVNAAIFLPLHHFYLQKSYYKRLIHMLICGFSLKFSHFMKNVN